MAPWKTSIIAGMAAVGLAMAMAGCVLTAKTAAKTPPTPKPSAPSTPPPPVQLSIPQTQVELPRAQPYDLAALAVETAPSPPPQTEAPSPSHTAGPPARPRPRPEPVTPPAAQPPAEPERPSVGVIMSAAEIKRLQESAQGRRRDVVHILEELKPRRLSQTQKNIVTSIRSLVTLSEEAEKRNDMGTADTLAERAQILAKDLQNGR